MYNITKKKILLAHTAYKTALYPISYSMKKKYDYLI